MRKFKSAAEIVTFPTLFPPPHRDHDDETSVFDAVSKLNEVGKLKELSCFYY